jgi:hypothetical protein
MSYTRRMVRLFVTLTLCAACWLPAAAVTLAPLTFEQLVNNSAAVVLGRVTDVRGEFVSGGRGIESIVTVNVLKGIKGADVETVQFTVPGGQAGRYLNVIPGAPTFAPGDLAVVFLTARGARLPVTTGLTQGVYRVRGSGAQMTVMPPPIENAGQRMARGDVRRKPVSWAAFEASVRAIVDASAAAPAALRRINRGAGD